MATVALENDHYASVEQQVAVIVVAAFSSSLSLFGSLSIVTIIVKNKKWGRGLFYRLMMGITVGDMIGSLGFLIGPYVEPPNDHIIAAYGNTATCSFGGVLVYTLLLTVYYNCALSIFYYCTIVQGMKEDLISKRYEKWMHSVPIGVTASVHIVALSLQAYNPTEVARNCGISHYPTGCEHDENVHCTRGLYTYELGYVVLAMLSVPTFLGIGLTIWVYLHVRRVLKANQRHSFDTSITRDRENHRRREVAQQALLYCIALMNTLAWAVATIIYDWASTGNTRATLGRPEIFAFNLLNAFFVPLQGLFNFVVYARPRYLELRKQNPEEGRFYVFRQLYSSTPRPGASVSRVVPQEKKSNLTFQAMDSLAGAQKESALPTNIQAVDSVASAQKESALPKEDPTDPTIVASNANSAAREIFIEEGNVSG